MNRETARTDTRKLIEAGRERMAALLAAGRHRRRGLCMALLLAVPMLAWAQPLGLLLWARLRLLTDIPRTAMATDEEATRIAVDPPAQFPDLAVIGLDNGAERNPLQISPRHFPGNTPRHEMPTREIGNDGRETTQKAKLGSVARKFRLQALISRNSIAIIDDRTYRVGEFLDVNRTEGISFVLRSVGRNSVIVEADGHEFEVRLVGGGADRSVSRVDSGGIRR
ncbi:MAG: hypothetical protein MK085_02500 [Phycisphaerales bacterium]|nr:hypothetical protein [Phycisphaerales bacterium]